MRRVVVGEERKESVAASVERVAERDGGVLAEEGVGEPAAEQRRHVRGAEEREESERGVVRLPEQRSLVEEENEVAYEAVEGKALERVHRQQRDERHVLAEARATIVERVEQQLGRGVRLLVECRVSTQQERRWRRL